MKVYVITELYNLTDPEIEVSANVDLFLMKQDAEDRVSSIISEIESSYDSEDKEAIEITHEKTINGEYYSLFDSDSNNISTITLEEKEVI